MKGAMQTARYDFKKRGQRFVLILCAILLLVGLFYALLHWALPPAERLPKKSSVVTFLGASKNNTYGNGVLLITDESNALFYLGRVRIELFREKVYSHNDEIERLITSTQVSLIRSLGQLRVMIGDAKEADVPVLDALLDAIDAGDYGQAAKIWQRIIRLMSPPSLAELGTLPESMLAGIMRLGQLKREQIQTYEGLATPRLAELFWVTGYLAMIEVLFWSFFGVVTNLLVNSARFLTQGDYRPIEQFVGYTKLIYGPMLSIVLVLAILIGWIDVGNYETVSWALPVLGFIFGYNSRKTAALIDRLSERILGAAQKSIDEGPAAVTEKRLDILRGLLRDSKTAESFDELIKDAKDISDEVVTAIVAKKEAGS